MIYRNIRLQGCSNLLVQARWQLCTAHAPAAESMRVPSIVPMQSWIIPARDPTKIPLVAGVNENPLAVLHSAGSYECSNAKLEVLI